MDEKKLTIYFTSDLHGYIYPTDYRGQGEKELGLFKCASRFRKDGNTLVIDGGDILQGSPLGAFCHDTVGSAARFADMMNRCGYDYVTLGNHAGQGYEGTFREMYDKKDNAYFLQNVKDIFEADDMTIVNFEGVLTFCDDLVEKEFNMKGDPEYIGILTEASVEAVSFGNNHRLDYGQQGSDDTVAAFEEAGIVYAYDNITGIYETQGIRIGFVSVNEVYDGNAVEAYLEDGIRYLREEEQVNLVIACCHWGEERENYPEDYQKELGHKCIDWGADLVLGAHAHVLQGVEVYKERFIVYGLANFCFGGNRNPKDKDTMIFQQTFTFVDGVKQEGQEAKVIPCSVSSVSYRNDFCPTPADGGEYTRILGRINEYSSPFGVAFDEEGSYIP